MMLASVEPTATVADGFAERRQSEPRHLECLETQRNADDRHAQHEPDQRPADGDDQTA